MIAQRREGQYFTFASNGTRCAKHEAFHVRQYNYIWQRGGIEAFDRVVEYLATTPYEDNIFEAWFQCFIAPPEQSVA